MQVRFIMILHAWVYNSLSYPTLHMTFGIYVSKYKPFWIGQLNQLIQVKSFISVFLVLLFSQSDNITIHNAIDPKHLSRIYQPSGLFFSFLLLLFYLFHIYYIVLLIVIFLIFIPPPTPHFMMYSCKIMRYMYYQYHQGLIF